WAAVERRAAGNTGAGGHLVADYESLGAALGAVAQVLERDVDGRYAAAFGYSDGDEDAARRVRTAVESRLP
ncbi:MAG: hypothetical protein ACRCSN_18395, partial [Dermatophilaceae bacterium]